MGPNGSKFCKKLLLLQIAATRFQICIPNFPPNGSHKTTLRFLKFTALTIFPQISNLPLCPLGKLNTSIICKTSDRGAKRCEMWGTRGVVQSVWSTFGLVAFKIILKSFGVIERFAAFSTPEIRIQPNIL